MTSTATIPASQLAGLTVGGIAFNGRPVQGVVDSVVEVDGLGLTALVDMTDDGAWHVPVSQISTLWTAVLRPGQDPTYRALTIEVTF